VKLPPTPRVCKAPREPTLAEAPIPTREARTATTQGADQRREWAGLTRKTNRTRHLMNRRSAPIQATREDRQPTKVAARGRVRDNKEPPIRRAMQSPALLPLLMCHSRDFRFAPVHPWSQNSLRGRAQDVTASIPRASPLRAQSISWQRFSCRSHKCWQAHSSQAQGHARQAVDHRRLAKTPLRNLISVRRLEGAAVGEDVRRAKNKTAIPYRPSRGDADPSIHPGFGECERLAARSCGP